MINNDVLGSSNDAATAKPRTAALPESITTAQLARTILESTLLQAKFNQSIMARIEDLTNGVRQTHEMLQQISQNLNHRIEKLSAANLAWGRFAAPVGEDLLLTKVLNTFLMFLEASDLSISPHLIADGCWEKTITDAFVARLRPGMTVIDVGANYGYYSLLAACCVGDKGRVYSFEPNPRTFEVLVRNIEVNCVSSIVWPYQIAVLDSQRQIELHVLRKFQGSSSQFVPELVPEPDTPPAERPLVGSAALDQVIQDQVAHLIKIDAEGSEPQVFEGMQGILSRNPDLTIFMEINVPMIRKCADPVIFLNRIRALGGTIQYFTPWNTLEPFDQEKALQFPLFNLLVERKRT